MSSLNQFFFLYSITVQIYYLYKDTFIPVLLLLTKTIKIIFVN